MKPVRCSWVDMQKIRVALSSGRRGDQKALEQLRCVDKSTVSRWMATSGIMDAFEGKVALMQLSAFQPTHAMTLARAFRKRYGKKPSNWPTDEVVEWVEHCEANELTVEQFQATLTAAANAAPVSEGRCCSIADLHGLAQSGPKFGTIYADPPWQYGNQATRAATDNHYSTMTVEQIAALPVRELAAEQSHLWLWTTNGFLFECPKLFDSWGFEFKSSFVWVKPQMGIGNYLRNSHELLLLAVRGGLVGQARDVMSWGEFDRTEHSAKPETIRSNVIERISPGPRLELFGRRFAPGWRVWGNEIDRTMFDPEHEVAA